MRKLVTFAAIVTSAALLWAAPVRAQSNPPQDDVTAATDSQPSRARKARPRLRVQPLYPYRRYHSLYPLPYDVEYPGPNAKRACAARYVTEYRPSGTVVVPRMNCWWVRG